jgi:hypothetical protein
MPNFPAHLAESIHMIWDGFVAGDYKPPPCPPKVALQELLEVASVASAAPEEGRYPKFNLIALPAANAGSNCGWRFDEARKYDASQLRGLIPATDANKSAIVVEWDTAGSLYIAGLCDLGTSWRRARLGLAYRYNSPPHGLIVEIPRPGQIHVFQSEFRLGSLVDGVLDVGGGYAPTFSLDAMANGGLSDLSEKLCRPEIESERMWAAFEFIAIKNVYASIANSISASGHGGALVILPSHDSGALSDLRIKYRYKSSDLSARFVSFMNTRHRWMDLIEKLPRGKDLGAEAAAMREQTLLLDVSTAEAWESLVECIRFTAQFAGCDGALVLSRDLTVLGFGAEIRTELRGGVEILGVVSEMKSEGTSLDVESFGMRHRSAVKLVSHHNDACVLVVSQDGPVSAVWTSVMWDVCHDGRLSSEILEAPRRVLVRKGIRLANQNLPWM